MGLTTALDDELLDRLIAAVGEPNLLTDPDIKLAYECDVTGRYSGTARAVVLPADAAECAAVLMECARHGVSVVPQGGNTGLVGGAVPRAGEIVLSTRRMNTIEELDELTGQLTVGAGVILADVQAAARAEQLELALDHGARSAATIGGLVATDAGGSLALRHGTMRKHVVGIEAVLPDGRVVARLSGLLKDNAGYRWPELLVGSEGTLAVITRVRIALTAVPQRSATAMFGTQSFPNALALLASLRAHAPSLRAADFFTSRGLELVRAHRKLPLPLRSESPIYVIAECAGGGDLLGELATAARAAGQNIDVDAAVADDSAARARLWAYRDAQNEAIRANGVAHKLDVSIPLRQLSRLVAALETQLAQQRPAAQLVLYGHLGDGNLHINILGLDESDLAIDESVLRLVVAHGGTISAEHGIGVAKAAWLGLVRSDEEIALMRSIKAAFDPAALLSPGRVLAAELAPDGVLAADSSTRMPAADPAAADSAAADSASEAPR